MERNIHPHQFSLNLRSSLLTNIILWSVVFSFVLVVCLFGWLVGCCFFVGFFFFLGGGGGGGLIDDQTSRKQCCEYRHFDQVCDVMNKSGLCGRIGHYVMSKPFLLFIGNERTNMVAP